MNASVSTSAGGLWRRVSRRPAARTALAVIVLIVLLAVFAPATGGVLAGD